MIACIVGMAMGYILGAVTVVVIACLMIDKDGDEDD